jgi:hypothetical protein
LVFWQFCHKLDSKWRPIRAEFNELGDKVKAGASRIRRSGRHEVVQKGSRNVQLATLLAEAVI